MPLAWTSTSKARCYKRRKSCKPTEETDIDLYAVKKIARPRLPAYSGWGISKLHDGFLWGRKCQFFRRRSTDGLLIWIVTWWFQFFEVAMWPKRSHVDVDFSKSACDQLRFSPGDVVEPTLLQIPEWKMLDRKTMEETTPFFQGPTVLYRDP